MIRKTLALAVVASVLTACGATAPSKKAGLAPEEAIAQRAKARWDAIIAKEYEKAYSFMTAGARATTPFDNYANRLAMSAVQWKNAEVEQVTCEEADVCVARVRIESKIRSPSAGGTGVGMLTSNRPVLEDWLRGSDGQWYFLPKTTGR